MKYEYKATLKKVVDADTIDVIVDLGFSISTNLRLRLARIDAWEIRGEERVKGLKAKEFVIKNLPEEFTIKTQKDKKGKYGRYIAEIIYNDDINLNDELIKEGHATLYK